jgi:hypothetical protein
MRTSMPTIPLPLYKTTWSKAIIRKVQLRKKIIIKINQNKKEERRKSPIKREVCTF